ncbi:Uncharacterised protein [Mycobacterium tuberculosis]|uniref:Uncharacterized protein n=2 Tax=Mycobacterium tuberculosis TaxID=1773 RepID=A0A655FFJ3_MYCTX|nr:Uncharacterised protein [Mycobacterium tuberculosis]CFR92567.1 Uncharacterised protein [Mycobacterium tuberculosis]CFS19089.1 Uncharacterised protein [Mycobacterium tuberculosis]CKS24283.1 Uncharacterised protein [Mycobacterium tuberculosis]CKS42842.1 Uncharacterised protein [Mycobacterium tuberculosis]
MGERGFVRPDQEVVDRYLTFTRGPFRQAHRIQNGAHGRQVLGRIRLAERTAQGAAVADHRVGDHPLGIAEDRAHRRQRIGVQNLSMAGHRTQPNQVGIVDSADHDVAEFGGQVVDVHEVLGVGDAQLHHRQQAVPAGDHPRSLPQPIQQSDGVVHAGGTFVFERPRYLHAPQCRPPAKRASMSS